MGIWKQFVLRIDSYPKSKLSRQHPTNHEVIFLTRANTSKKEPKIVKNPYKWG